MCQAAAVGKTHERIAGRLREFIEAQPVFFTATAPLAATGTVNLSPKGVTGSFAVLDEHWNSLLKHFPDVDASVHGLRAIVVVHAELVRDTCGYAVPFMTYDADRDLHAKRFAREDDASLSSYFAGKEHVATSIDGLPGLPLPLPPTPPA
jgi:hypothetical protein